MLRMRKAPVTFTLAAGLVLCASMSPAREPGGEVRRPGAPGGSSGDDAASLSDIERLRKSLSELHAELAELLRRCRELVREAESRGATTRAAVEDYLETRGITGLAFTDRDLRPLDRVLRRATLGAGLRMRYGLWDDLVDLSDGTSDLVDYAELRARLIFACALAAGPEIEFELQGLSRQRGLFELPTDIFLVPPPAGWPGMDPEYALPGDEGLELRRAEVRLPAFNLLGRLAHVPVTLVVGRQELAFGNGFFLGADDEGAGISWDAVRLYAESGEGGRVDVFAGRAGPGAREVAAHIRGPVDPAADPEIEIAGVRGETRGLLPDSALAAYYVRSHVGRIAGAAPYATIPRVELNTLGVEVSSELTTRLRLRLDGAVQWGEVDAREVDDAGAAAVEIETSEGATALSFFAAYGSEDFVPLAQDVRGRWDEVGLFSSRNTWLWGVRFSRKSEAGAQAGVCFTQGYAPEPGSPAGFAVRTTPGPGDRIGEVVSAFASWPLFDDEGSYLRLSYAHFAPGDYFASPADPADRLRVELGFGF